MHTRSCMQLCSRPRNVFLQHFLQNLNPIFHIVAFNNPIVAYQNMFLAVSQRSRRTILIDLNCEKTLICAPMPSSPPILTLGGQTNSRCREFLVGLRLGVKTR